ncbi:hypothetical protein G6F40_017452 [Rhizopus arrhizus]|nr:hypothetical protein G6F40_017452 [Rhizopus arrhizus]KAG1247653.1 hypothetical protein G6F65_020051 [Rhizopus arrhizus]
MVISATSLSDVSEMAIVPDRECRMPTLMVSSAANTCGIHPDMANRLKAVSCFTASLRFMVTPGWNVPAWPAGTI